MKVQFLKQDSRGCWTWQCEEKEADCNNSNNVNTFGVNNVYTLGGNNVSQQMTLNFCTGYDVPETGTKIKTTLGSYDAPETGTKIIFVASKLCLQWMCAEDGMERQGAKCVPGSTSDAVEKPKNPCDKKPAHATKWKEIQLTKDKKGCAATECAKGYYLVKNAKGQSQGWCKYGTEPVMASQNTEEQALFGSLVAGNTQAFDCKQANPEWFGTDDVSSVIAHGTSCFVTRLQETEQLVAGVSQCEPSFVAQNASQFMSGMFTACVAAKDAHNVETKAHNVEVKPRDECEKGTFGYVVFENQCITLEEKTRIENERVITANATTQIKDVAGKMHAISDTFKVNVWKNKEGDFNTARLASDSIAGAVLGTAGGIITSKVIKKNQIQNGLENLKCTVGGQEVARWGDAFSIGAQ